MLARYADHPVTAQHFVKKLSKQHVLNEGLTIYRRLQGDDQDSVRLLTVEDLIAIAQQLTPAEVKEQLLKQIRQSMTDKSWRVRYMGASHFNEVSIYTPEYELRRLTIFRQLAEAVGQELVKEELIQHYVQLLKDNEAEVRTAAAGQIPGACYFLVISGPVFICPQALPSSSIRRLSCCASFPASATSVRTLLSMSARRLRTRSRALHRSLGRMQPLNIFSRCSCTSSRTSSQRYG